MFCNFFLSSLGYEDILGLTEEEIKTLFPEPDEDNTGVNFLKGMEASQQELNDPSPETWEAGYRGRQNNFKYDIDDPNALKCPFHGHIRKTNPRGDIAKNIFIPRDEEKNERSRRIVWRGITYGIRKDDPNADLPPEQRPTKDVGLLFMCFHSIPRQFGFMQMSWANNINFVKQQTGRDLVIGQKGSEDSVPQT